MKTKNIAVSEKVHYAHKLNCAITGKKVRAATEEALSEYWQPRLSGRKTEQMLRVKR